MQRIDELLRWRAETQPTQHAYSFLRDGTKPDTPLTYAALDRRARTIAAYLQSRYEQGSRVVLSFGEGTDFVEALFGCFYAGMIAVPAPTPDVVRLKRSLIRLELIVADATPVLILASDHINILAQTFPAIDCMLLRSLDDVDDWQKPLQAYDLAYLQYTSGSTSKPKGVMITHDNLINNVRDMSEKTPAPPGSISTTWMPNFHDYGLVAGVLYPLYVGMPAYLATTRSFLKRPASWLEAISRLQITHTGAATFAFDYCVQRVSAIEKQRLNLRHLQNVTIGAETIHAQTLEAFCDAFAPVGFRPEVLHPAYGLAEMTLLTTVHAVAGQTAILLRRGERTIVGCGLPVSRTTLRIVDPQTRMCCNDGKSGEIWLAGPSVAAGYWNAPEVTRETFQAYLTDTHEGPFLRTGDLGFLHDGELFISGRLKNMLIVHGQNYYGEEIEKSIKYMHPRLNHQTTAVFGVDGPTEELIVVAQELERQTADVDDVTAAIRRAVSDDFGLTVHTIVFMKRGGLPRTTSGKLQRAECRAMYLDGTLPSLARWSLDAQPVVADTEACNDIQSTLIGMWQHVLARPVAPDDDYFQLGGTSLDAVRLISDVEHHFETRIPDTFFGQPTVSNMARLLQKNIPNAAVSSSQHRPDEPATPDVPRERVTGGLSLRFATQRIEQAKDRIMRMIHARVSLLLINKLRTVPKSIYLLVLIEFVILNLPYRYGRRLLLWWVKRSIVQQSLYRRNTRIISDFVAHVHGHREAEQASIQRGLASKIMSEHSVPRTKARETEAETWKNALRGPFWKPFRQAIEALKRNEPTTHITFKQRSIVDSIEPGRSVILVTYHSPWLRLMELILNTAFERPIHSLSGYSVNRISTSTFKGEHAHMTKGYDPRAVIIHMRAVQEKLQQGRIIIIAADGSMGTGRPLRLPFLSSSYAFNVGFAELAIRTNSLVVPVYASMTLDGRIEIVFDPPFNNGDEHTAPDVRVESLVRQYATYFERALQDDPANVGVGKMKLFLKPSTTKRDITEELVERQDDVPVL